LNFRFREFYVSDVSLFPTDDANMQTSKPASK